MISNRLSELYKEQARDKTVTRKIITNRYIKQQKLNFEQLIKRGADMTIRNKRGMNCFDICRNLPKQQRAEMDVFLRKCSEHVLNFKPMKTDGNR